MITKRGRNLLYILFLVLLMIFAVSCKKNQFSLTKNKNDIDYVLSLSRSRENRSTLLFISNDGTIKEKLKYKGASINSLNYIDDKIYMHSSRTNDHFIYDDNGFEKFSLESEYADSPNITTWFVKKGNDDLIEGINVGLIDTDYYLSSLAYSNNKVRNEILLKWEYLDDAIEVNGKIFLEAYNEKTSKYSIIVIDKEEKTSNRINFEKPYTDPGKQMIQFNESVVDYGHIGSSSLLYLIDSNTNETKEITLKNENILYVFVNDNLKVITNKNIYDLNSELEIINKKEIKDTDLIKDIEDNKFGLRKINDNENILSVLYTSEDFDKVEVGFIREYDKKDLKLIRNIDIKLDRSREWMGEEVDFIRLK
ncbi:hypothetical protein [Facklamia sp. P12932]|uniref:hypothetical protein n=1 Tax=Facklamia sp. P12932 TaxID=3421947 RepID=UPI003D17B5EF